MFQESHHGIQGSGIFVVSARCPTYTGNVYYIAEKIIKRRLIEGGTVLIERNKKNFLMLVLLYLHKINHYYVAECVGWAIYQGSLCRRLTRMGTP